VKRHREARRQCTGDGKHLSLEEAVLDRLYVVAVKGEQCGRQVLHVHLNSRDSDLSPMHECHFTICTLYLSVASFGLLDPDGG
jgi:hypothetical protein